MKLFSVLLLSTVIVAASLAAAFADETADKAAIGNLLTATFDKPDARLAVDPIVVEETYAIADWTQGDMGGRGFLRNNGHDWVLILCGGDGLKSASVLRDVGVPDDAATKLAAKLSIAEAKLDASRIAQLSRFDGIMYMEKDQHGSTAAK